MTQPQISVSFLSGAYHGEEWQKYQQVESLRDDEQPDQHLQCYNLLELDGRSPYVRDPREGIVVAAMLRHAINGLLQREGFETQTIQELLGHGKKGSQIACLPLPSIGHRHADGMIRRVMLKTTDSFVLDRLGRGLDGCDLRDKEHPVAMLSPIRGSDVVVDRFTCESEVWETVTPVILPGYDQIGNSKRKTEKLISRSILHSGFTPSQVCRIWYRESPWNHHGYPAGTYQTAMYMRYPQYHVRVEFRRPVCGPLILGSGRYFGLGLMVGTEENSLYDAA
jgi:CRISPR-associated protein Csb2